jgi:YVTN family beta-propeller protein
LRILQRLIGLCVPAALMVSCQNHLPLVPTAPDGPRWGYTDSVYRFTAGSDDPDGDALYIRFAWGDGDTTGWLQQPHGIDTLAAGHVWSSRGRYSIRAQAKDGDGLETAWSQATEVVIDTLALWPTRVLAVVRLDSVPFDVTVAPDGQYLFVACYGGGSISVVRASDWTVTATVPVSEHVADLAVSPDGSRLYVGTTAMHVYVVSTATNAVIDSIRTHTNPWRVVLDQAGAYLYVGTSSTGGDGSRILKVRTADNMVVDSFDLNQGTTALTLKPDGSGLYVSTITERVRLLATDALRLLDTLKGSWATAPLLASDDGTELYAWGLSNEGRRRLDVYGTLDNTLKDTIGLPGTPSLSELVGFGRGRLLFATGSPNLFVFDMGLRAIVARLELAHTRGIAASEQRREMYLTDEYENKLIVLGF